MKKTRLTRRKKKLTIRQNIRKHVLSGLLVLVPVGITAFVLMFLYGITAKPLASIIRSIAGELPQFYIVGVSIVVFVAILYLIGLVTTVYLGRKLLNLAEAIIQWIPVVKTVYSATKQVVDAVSLSNGSTNYKSAVFVEFPNPGALSIAFLTGRITASDGTEYLKVFVPTTPNPTSGFFQLIKPEKVVQSDLSVEDAIKFLMSCGIVAPPLLGLDPVGPVSESPVPQTDDEDYDWVEEEIDDESAGHEKTDV